MTAPMNIPEGCALLEPRERFDAALVGCVERIGQPTIACYDYELTIAALTADGMSQDEAEEWFHHNIMGSWRGDTTPCFLHTGVDE